jgi:hypothetical protein
MLQSTTISTCIAFVGSIFQKIGTKECLFLVILTIQDICHRTIGIVESKPGVP